MPTTISDTFRQAIVDRLNNGVGRGLPIGRAKPGEDGCVAGAPVLDLRLENPPRLEIGAAEEGLVARVRYVETIGSRAAQTNRTLAAIERRLLRPPAQRELTEESFELLGLLVDAWRSSPRTSDDLLGLILPALNAVYRARVSIDWVDGEIILHHPIVCDLMTVPEDFDDAVTSVILTAGHLAGAVRSIREAFLPDPTSRRIDGSLMRLAEAAAAKAAEEAADMTL